MAKIWLAIIDGTQHGPLSNSELKSLADSGKLKQNDNIWKEGLAEWIPAGKIKGLFTSPPKPPIPPPQPPPAPEAAIPSIGESFGGLEPSLGEIIVPDDEASEAWKNREAPLQGDFGLFGGFIKKQIQELTINHRQRVFRHFENGKQIPKTEILNRLETNYAKRGFRIQRFATALVVTKTQEEGNIGSLINGFIRVAESGDSWAVSVKGEAFFWSKAMQQLAGAAGLACIALIFFWPCLCIVPFMFNVDADKAKTTLSDDLKTPVEKLPIEFQ